MADYYREVEQNSSVTNGLISLLGPVFGVLLLLFSLRYQIDNEYAEAELRVAFNSIPKTVSELNPASAPALEGKLVHVTGVAHAEKPVLDPNTGASFAALLVNRKVEMYQWNETIDSDMENRLGGSSTTVRTYKYDKVWSDRLNDSRGFEHSINHENPTSMPFSDASIPSSRVKLGAYVVPSNLVAQLRATNAAIPPNSSIPNIAHKLGRSVEIRDNALYVSKDPTHPQIGDLRISYQKTNSDTPISITAQKQKNTFAAFHPDKSKAAIYLIAPGELAADSMVKVAKKTQDEDLFGKRSLALVMTFFALLLCFLPIKRFFNIVPFMGDLFGQALLPACIVIAGLINGIMLAGIWLKYDPIFATKIVLCIWLACLALMMLWKGSLGLLRRLGILRRA